MKYAQSFAPSDRLDKTGKPSRKFVQMTKGAILF